MSEDLEYLGKKHVWRPKNGKRPNGNGSSHEEDRWAPFRGTCLNVAGMIIILMMIAAVLKGLGA